jgi:hypothetical protein
MNGKCLFFYFLEKIGSIGANSSVKVRQNASRAPFALANFSLSLF